ncbi:unnamed protein product [Alternaria alternata]
MPAVGLSHPHLFRTYRVRENMNVNCKIWEAARATTAAPTFFKRISIGEQGQFAEEYMDGGLRCNNPVKQVIQEARMIFGEKRAIGIIVNIGSGHPGSVNYSKPSGLQRFLPTKLIDILKSIATDCESVTEEMHAIFADTPGTYIRLNVTHGAGKISLEEWEKMVEVQGYTKEYLKGFEVSKDIDVVAAKLCGTK